MFNKSGLNKYHKLFYSKVLHSYQRDWFDQIINNRYSMIVGARQIGKSYLTAWASIFLCLGFKDSPAHNVHVVSKDDRNSRLIIEKIQEHLGNIHNIVEDITHDKLGSTTKITLRNGKYIQAFPGKAESLRGFTGTVLIDEIAASNEDMDELFAMAASVASAQPYYKIIGLTNAGNAGGWLHSFLYSEKPSWIKRRAPYSISITNIYDAYPAGLPKHVVEIKDSISPRLWRREYECEFVSGQGGYLEADTLDEISTESFAQNGTVLISIDPGFTSDASGIVVARVGHGKIDVIQSEALFGCDVDKQVQYLSFLKEEFKANKIIIDAGVGGLVMAQALENKFGSRAVDRVHASRQKQNRWMHQLEAIIKSNNLAIPDNDNHILRDDLAAFGIDKLNNLVVPRRKHKNTQYFIHCDVGMALLYLTDYAHVQSNRAQIRSVSHMPAKSRSIARW